MSLFDCMACYPKLCHCGGEEYRPKGGMCMTCLKRDQDCSGLPFASMPVIMGYEDNDGHVVTVVRCTQHQRGTTA